MTTARTVRTFAEYLSIAQEMNVVPRADGAHLAHLAPLGPTGTIREAVAHVAALLQEGGEVVVGGVGWAVPPDPESAADLRRVGLAGSTRHAFPWNKVYWALVGLGAQEAADLCWGRAREYEAGVAHWARAPFALPVSAPTGPNDHIGALCASVGGWAGSRRRMWEWSERSCTPIEAYLVAMDAIVHYPWARELTLAAMYRTHACAAHKNPWTLDGAFVLPHGEFGALVYADTGWRVYEGGGGEGDEPANNAELVDLIKAGLRRLNARRKACAGLTVCVTHVSSAQMEQAYAWAARLNASVAYMHLHFSEEPRAHAALQLPDLFPTVLGD